MASHLEAIIIADDEESPGLEPGNSRPRRAPRRDYSYRDFESMIGESVGDEADTTPSRKRKRTEAEQLTAMVSVLRSTLFFLD
jgi:hypothetical protein